MILGAFKNNVTISLELLGKKGYNSHVIKIIYSCDKCNKLGKTNWELMRDRHSFKPHLCSKCKGNLKKTINRRKKTCLQKYGTISSFQNKDVRDKYKKKLIKKYGVDSPLKNKTIYSKLKKTNLEKYGVENIFSLESIKTQIKKTNLVKYGFEYCGFLGQKKVNNFEFSVYTKISQYIKDLYYCQKLDPDSKHIIPNKLWVRKLSDGKNHIPDFKIKGTNKIIECHGTYWHRNELIDRGKKLIKLYLKSNLDCYIIWEDYWKKCPNYILQDIYWRWLL